MEKEKLYSRFYNSPLGFMEITASEEAVISIKYGYDKSRDNIVTCSVIDSCINQLDEYFAGTRQVFDITLKLAGTEFQKNVWYELLKIPYGVTISYKELSHRLDNEKAIRAVGAANGKNPVNIIVPCHRVIGADGSLTGYGGGLWRKKWLLEHEEKFSMAEKQLSIFQI
jgi:methylated-DNA-[protein]-cysteine S-methyltransferase